MSAQTWRPFGVDEREFDDAPATNGTRIVNLSLRHPRGEGTATDRAATWLRAAMGALGVLAAAAAVVSYEAQYRMVFAAKGVAPIAALEAAIPDVAALVFASLGIALALHGRQAIRARVLNVGAVATSIAMNMLAAGHGFRDLAIWVMPPVAYALASDTAIGVIRSHAIARQRELGEALAGDETTPLAVLGGVALWLLRLALAAPSTLRGFRRWVVQSSPVAPGVAPAAVTAANESAAKAIEAAHVTAGQQVTEAARAQDEAARRAQAAEQQAAAAQQAAASAQTELRRAREDFADGRDQLRSTLQRVEDERSRLASTAQELQTALAAQRAEAVAGSRAAEAARGEAQLVREDAARQVVQMREDFIRERAEYRESLGRMREAMQAADADCRQAARERDEVLAELTAARAAAQPRVITAGRKPAAKRGESKTAQFLGLVKAREGELAGIDPAKVARIAADLAPQVGLDVGAARSALRPRVLAAQAGGVS